MVQALILAMLVFMKNYQSWEILSLSTVLGIINRFDVPARQAMVYEMVEDKKDFANTLALNSTIVFPPFLLKKETEREVTVGFLEY